MGVRTSRLEAGMVVTLHDGSRRILTRIDPVGTLAFNLWFGQRGIMARRNIIWEVKE